MNYLELKSRRASLKSSAHSLIDMTETNLYRSLPNAFPGEFPSIEPSADRRSMYRCHLAEELRAALSLSNGFESRLLVSHGVRRSLAALFGVLAGRGKSVLIPSDVYPVYFDIARSAGVSFGEYAAREGVPAPETLARHDAVLLCDPLKPWGGAMSPGDCERIAQWAREGNRLAIVDAAYGFIPSPPVMRLAQDGGCALLGSLSKGWLIPDHVGYCLIPETWRDAARDAFRLLPKDETKLRVGFAALTEHAARRELVSNRLLTLAERLSRRLTELRVPIRPVNGYFARTDATFDELLAKGVIGIPGSVFGAPESAGCLVSSLPPVE